MPQKLGRRDAPAIRLPAASVAVHILAKKIAVVYLRKVKAKSLWASPWAPGIPVEEQPVFRHFIALAKIIRSTRKTETPIDYEEFVRAQFECWNGPPSRYPWPQQLTTEQSFGRYTDWLTDRADSEKRVVKLKHLPPEERYRPEQKMLKRLAEAQGLTERKALLLNAEEFSEGFLRFKKVWLKVRKRYVRFHGDDA